MVVFPNCKINLGLSVKHRRPDGYHEIETIFYPAGWKDVLEIIRSPDDTSRVLSSGLAIDTNENICLKAYRLLRAHHNLPPVHIHLHKAIPMGAGLGGGSADGTFTLRLLNEKFGLGLPDHDLLSFALELGSDCPFFVSNQPCIATGRGEKMEPVDINLEGYHLLIVYPPVHVSTSEAFSSIEFNTGGGQLKEVIGKPVSEWKDLLFNDFEKTIFKKHRAIGELKEWFYRKGALYASMSGSGSAVYGFFENVPDHSDLPSGYLSFNSPGKI